MADVDFIRMHCGRKSFKMQLPPFEEQTEDNRLFSHLCENFNPLDLSSFPRYSYLIPAMHSGKIDMSPSFLLR